MLVAPMPIASADAAGEGCSWRGCWGRWDWATEWVCSSNWYRWYLCLYRLLVLWEMVGQGRMMSAMGLGDRVDLVNYRVQWVVMEVEQPACRTLT